MSDPGTNNPSATERPAHERFLTKLPFADIIRHRVKQLGPGTQSFLASLSIVTVAFGLSKIFSSVANIIFTHYLGKEMFGEANVVLQVSQVLSMLMLAGFHVSVMRFGSGQENPAPAIATLTYCTVVGVLIFGLVGWAVRGPFMEWLNLTDRKVVWAIAIAAMFSIYSVLTSGYQALALFKHRGVVELAFAAMLIPAIYLGHKIFGKNYQTLVLTYAVSYGLLVPIILWRFRHLLSPKNLFPPNTREMVTYGVFAGLSNIGFILMFAIQPLQLLHATDESTVGIFRLYTLGSIQMATFATGIFYAVFFPKVSASRNRPEIWRLITRAWIRAGVPVFVLFATVLSVTILCSSREFPYVWSYVFMFSAVSTVIAVHSTYGQILAAQGIRGMRWTVLLATGVGLFNLMLSHLIIPKLGIAGAVLTLLVSYLLLLFGTILLKDLIKHDHEAGVAVDTAREG